MQIRAWLGDGRDGNSRGFRRHSIERTTEVPTTGDNRDQYGYGHRAHRPDPTAGYRFDNDPNYWVRHPLR